MDWADSADQEAFRKEVRGFIESPERGTQILLQTSGGTMGLIDFIEQGSGLFNLKPHPDSFLEAEHLASGLIDHNAIQVTIGESERAEFELLTLVLE